MNSQRTVRKQYYEQWASDVLVKFKICMKNDILLLVTFDTKTHFVSNRPKRNEFSTLSKENIISLTLYKCCSLHLNQNL